MKDGELSLLMQRFDVARWCVEEHGATHEGHNELLMWCPKCAREKISVNTRTSFWRCFICERYTHSARGKRQALEGAGGPLALVKWVEECSTSDAITKIAQFVSNALGSPTQLPELNFTPAAEAVVPLCPTGLPENCLAVDSIMPYMQRRGITLEDARAFGLGWCQTGWLKNRLVFPVWEQNKCIYWQARAMWDRHEHVARPYYRRDGTLNKDQYRKTLNPLQERRDRPGIRYFGSGDVLLNLEQAAQYPRVAICEGPTSAIRTGPDAIATFGKQLQPAQLTRLINAGVRAVDFMWDGPSENEPMGAWESMIRNAGNLSVFMDVRMVFLPKGDPGDYSREQLDWYRAHAEPYRTNATMLL